MRRNCIIKVIIGLLLLVSTTAWAKTDPLQDAKPFKITPAVKRYIAQTSKKYGIPKKQLQALFAQTKTLPRVIAQISSPFEARPWNFYRNYFITPARVKMGAAYWQKNEKTLEKVSKKYGVDPSVIIAILGVETLYGKHIGVYPVWDTLATLGFDYKPRQRFFRKELTQYLLLTRKQHLPILKLTGSYAGALGIPQFMPSSYRHYGVCIHKKCKVDLFNDHQAAMASIANYLKKSGWHRNQPVAAIATLNNSKAEKLASSRAKPRLSIAVLKRNGIESAVMPSKRQKVALVVLTNTDSKQYWLTYRNFSAIMSYNPNVNYAMAVYQLSRAIKNAHQKTNT